MARKRTHDYRDALYHRKSKARPLVRTEKRPGDLELVYREGDYRLHRYEDERAIGRG